MITGESQDLQCRKHTLFFLFSSGYVDESKSTKPEVVERRVCSFVFWDKFKHVTMLNS